MNTKKLRETEYQNKNPNSKLLVIFSIVSMVILSNTHSIFGQEVQEIVIVQEDKDGITFSYTPGISTKQMLREGKEFTSFELRSGIYEGNTLPHKQLLVAIPFESNPTATVLSSDFRTLQNIALPNVPDNALDAHDLLKSKEPALLRMQRVLPVNVYPIQYNNATKTARLLRSMTIRIDFNTQRVPISSASAGEPFFENNYKSLLVNYEAGKAWRKKPDRDVLRKTADLSSGEWYTIPVQGEGFYRITYNDLVTAGIDADNINPRSIKIFNNGGYQLEESLARSRPDGFIEIRVRVVGEEDGVFNQSDEILFYGRGTESWEWDTFRQELNHSKNVYTRTNTYWLTFGGPSGKRMLSVPFTDTNASPTTAGIGLVFREDEKVKMYNSGNNWFMSAVSRDTAFQAVFDLTGYREATPVRFRTSFSVRTFDSHRAVFFVNGAGLNETKISSPDQRIIRFTTNLSQANTVTYRLQNASSSDLSRLYLDWFEVEYDRNLIAVNDILKFKANGSGLQKFSVSGFSIASVDIYNITAFDEVTLVEKENNQSSSTFTFTDNVVNNFALFYALSNEQYLPVTGLTRAENSDLKAVPRSVDMLIITSDELSNVVETYKTFKEEHDNLRTEIVTVEDIYNEFSAGLFDPVAIRDFVKFAYENWPGTDGAPLKYVLLFGDGNYDYPNVFETSDKTLVPPFNYNSIFELVTRATDDFYGYVSGNDTFLDVALGRITAQSAEMAEDVINKLMEYQANPSFGPWRNRITFAADDEVTPNSFNEDLHTNQSEAIARASYMPKYLNQNKVYLMEFPEVRNVTTSGIRKPQAQNKLVSLMNEGSLIFNYIGHGNERVLADEWLLNREIDMPRINNGDKPFFFFLASCTFARWDLPDEDSMGELLLTLPTGGAIGLVCSARNVFASSNFELTDAFYNNFFNGTRQTEPIGIALMVAKHEVNGRNSEKYHFLGDPSMRLSLPGDFLKIASLSSDSLRALDKIDVVGNIEKPTSFSGDIFLSVFDSENDGVHIMRNGGVVTYKLPGAGIFRGSTSISAGANNQFNTGFIVPKDISYGSKNGRISLYAWNENEDAAVFIDQLPVGGTASRADDTDGPEIEVLFNDRSFLSGDLVAPEPRMTLILSDPNGINITGEVGHKIELSVGEEGTEALDISDLFSYSDGSYTEGQANLTLDDLTPGEHSLRVRAWDNFNNSSSFSGTVVVSEDQGLVVEDVVNFPNPFSNETQFTCQINKEAEIVIKIYTVKGRLIKVIDNQFTNNTSFFVSDVWDGRDEDGDQIANGTYMYKLIAKSANGTGMQQVEKIGKLVILR